MSAAERWIKELRLKTERLDIVAFSRELVGALDDLLLLARLIGASIPEGWPDEELSQLLRSYERRILEDSSELGYGPWPVVARDEGSVVGSAGFTRRPKHGAIELGFGIHSDFRNRGYATEAARALIDWGLAQPSVEQIAARCDPGNGPSVRVLEKIGMTRLGEEEGMRVGRPGSPSARGPTAGVALTFASCTATGPRASGTRHDEGFTAVSHALMR